MPFDVKNELSIVTGSAQGFGKEFAKRLLTNGCKVCLSDVNVEAGEKTLEEFRSRFGKDSVTFKKWAYFKKFMFSLEANNLVDEDGESMQTKGTYFESGWVDEEEEARKKSGSGFKFPWDK